MTACKTLLLVSLLAKVLKLPISQLAMHVDLFHLVTTEKWRPAAQLFSGRNILPPSLCGHSYKAPYPFQPSWCTLNTRVSPVVCASNKSFFSTCGVVFVWSFLTSGVKTWARLKGQLCLRLVPWLLCPALSWTQTAVLTPCAYGLWILDPTALPALPSTTSLSSTALHLTCFSPWTGCHSSRGCLLSLSLGHGCHSAMPGMPPMHAGAPLYLALGCLANQLGILYRWWPGPGTPTPGHPFMWHFPISLTLSLPLSLSLSLALLLCLPFLCLGWELNSPSSLLWPNSNWTILFSLPESCKGG
jgi:hypothetical protein